MDSSNPYESPENTELARGGCVLMRIVACNILVAVGYFLTWVWLDFRYIRTERDDFLSDWGGCVLFTIPVAFFFANKGLFLQRTAKVRYSLVAIVALLLSLAWVVVWVLLALPVHFAMGGSK